MVGVSLTQPDKEIEDLRALYILHEDVQCYYRIVLISSSS